MKAKVKSLDLRELISIAFELIAFFIMFRHQHAATTHDFFVEQFLFVMPYLVDFLFTTVKGRNGLFMKLGYWWNAILSLILLIMVLTGLFGMLNLTDQAALALTNNVAIPLMIMCPIEFLAILSIIAFDYHVKKIKE